MSLVESLVESSLDARFDKFELFALKNVFSVPARLPIVLNHYKNLNLQVTANDEAVLDEDIRLLRLDILKVHQF